MVPNRRRNNENHHNNGHDHAGVTSRPMKCCVPTECFDPSKLIYREDIGTSDLEVVKVQCNNDHCDKGEYMHKECFEAWEQTVLTYLKSCGRARSWSEKQRLQNLWTKRGYDLAFKACSCKCGKGHLRKDLDWIPPKRTIPIAIPGARAPPNQNQANPREENNHGGAVGGVVETNTKKKKKSKNKELKPTLAVSAPVPHPNNNNVNHHNNSHGTGRGSIDNGTCSNSSLSSSSTTKSIGGISGHPNFGSIGSNSSGSFDLSTSLPNNSILRPRMNSVSSNGSGSSGSSGERSPPPIGSQFTTPLSNIGVIKNHGRKNSRLAEIPDRTRRDSGNGLFSRRMDFSSFNKLPRHKLNSYHIKIEDEIHGNDETRNFILGSLNNAKIGKVSCILCSGNLLIFDRYPLIDGTLFLSPRQHLHNSIEIRNGDGKIQFLSAVCMGCLEGWQNMLLCRCCGHRWDGSDLILGTCYTYDIFAATPCCQERLCCSGCGGLLMEPDQRPTFFSEYSQASQCPHCGLLDFHLAKRLPEIFDKVSPILAN